MIHLIPYDGLGYTYHFLVGAALYLLLRRAIFFQVLVLVGVLAIGKELYDLLTDGAMDVWDIFFSLAGVSAIKGIRRP